MGPVVASELVYSAYRVLASKGIVLLWIEMHPGEIGIPARSSRERPFLHHKNVRLSPLWALFQGYLAEGVLAGETFLLLILGSMGPGH